MCFKLCQRLTLAEVLSEKIDNNENHCVDSFFNQTHLCTGVLKILQNSFLS